MRALAAIIAIGAATPIGVAAADEDDDALDEGVDDPVPDSWSAPPDPIGPNGTYGRYTDVRFRVTSGSGSWSADISPDGYEVTGYQEGSVADELSFRIDVLHSPGLRTGGGWFFGAGLEHARSHGSLMTDDARRTLYGWHLLGGWARPFGSKVQFELAAQTQFAVAYLRDTFPGAVTPTFEGVHLAIGADANLVYTDLSGWQLAVTAGARHGESHLHDPDDYGVELAGSSLGIGGFIGKRY